MHRIHVTYLKNSTTPLKYVDNNNNNNNNNNNFIVLAEHECSTNWGDSKPNTL